METKKRYAAKLFFQFRVVINGESSKFRTVEELIVLIKSDCAKSALDKIKSIAKNKEYSYLNNDGNTVFYEFIGVIDLIQLGIECEKNEVWYEIKTKLKPMENKKRLIPDEHELSAIKLETNVIRCA
jgi:hypothetical protein